MIDLKNENEIFLQGPKLVGGIDEAGRGPLAGPVVAACVACGPDFKITEELVKINDSKKLSHKKRDELYDVIMKSFEHVGVGICDQNEIDELNILQATFLAMKKAAESIKADVGFLMIDGNFIIPKYHSRQKAFVKGDERVFLIGAASIIAKVTRDRIMLEMHEKYPEYGFDKHKGYGTKFHMESLREHGPCPIHRISFRPVREALK